LGIAYERAVEPLGRHCTQSPIQEDLASGGSEEVGASDDLRDSGQDVVYYNSEFISRNVVAVPNQKIAKVSTREFFDSGKISIPIRNHLPVGYAKPPICPARGGEGFCFLRIASTMTWVIWFFAMRGEGGYFLPRMMTGVEKAGIAEAFPSFEVMGAA
jgi:hypothetical protein